MYCIFMIKNGKQVPLKFNFGAPSCVPATSFETAGAVIGVDGIEEMMQNLDIKNLKFHDLRHEAISRYFEKGLSVPEVALISGHKTVSQLFRYVHVKIPERM